MHLRNAAVAALGAFTLLLALPNSASAATGEFHYKTSTGTTQLLLDPASEECVNLPETTAETPGSAPQNLTASTATVFTEFDCDGDDYIVMNPGKKLGDNVKVRSVVFN
ncbi:hypothetical protein [Streptomyces sp. NPDC090021]|uniref:hypothetical protein n=1 Tax=Streptomyces sp. NPDC090021 TaxID=3365919 RepID=UPI003813FAD6